MNLTSPSQVRELLARLDVRPNRVLGQNFLIDRNILDILVGVAAPGREDTVLEIGPGLGVVTAELVRRAGCVAAVEKDAKLSAHLLATLGSCRNLLIVGADMLDVDVALTGESVRAAARAEAAGARLRLDLPGRHYDIVSNLPYSAGSRILVELARSAVPPRRMTVTVQQEVAERIVAAPGSKAYGMLGVWLQLDYEAELVRAVRPTCFFPRPEIGSAIVALRRRSAPRLEPALAERYYALTKHGFEHRRKQLAAILRQAPAPLTLAAGRLAFYLASRGLPATARPEELGIDDWCGLARLSASGQPEAPAP